MSYELKESWPFDWSDKDWNRVAQRISDGHREILDRFLKVNFRSLNAADREEILWDVFRLMLELLRYGAATRQGRLYTLEFFFPKVTTGSQAMKMRLKNATKEFYENHGPSETAKNSITDGLTQLARRGATGRCLKNQRISTKEEIVPPDALEGIVDPQSPDIVDGFSPSQGLLARLEENVEQWLDKRFPESNDYELPKIARTIAQRLMELEMQDDRKVIELVRELRKWSFEGLRRFHDKHVLRFMEPPWPPPSFLGRGGFGATYVAPSRGSIALKELTASSSQKVEPDYVSFAVTAATEIVPDSKFEVNVWAHLTDQRAEMIERAQEQHGTSALSVKTKGPSPLERGSVLNVELRVPSAEVYPEEDTIHWLGEVTNACFIVTVPASCTEKNLRAEATIRCQGLIVARLPFVLVVGKSVDSTSGVVATGSPIHSAFASYASEDNDEVLARIHGMQKALPGLKVFFDRAMIRSGERWQEILREEILKSDVLYLFWSEAVAKSKWVDWEWRCAFNAKGVQAIDPVPLVSPSVVKPPSELADLHFNDWILAYKRSNHS